MPSPALDAVGPGQGEPLAEVHPLWKTRLAAWVLVLGAFGVVLAGVEAPRFDLDRYLVPKPRCRHAPANAVSFNAYPTIRPARWGDAE